MDRMKFGRVGVGVMGQNLTLNIERNGFSVAVYDRDMAKVGEFLKGKARGKQISGAETVEAFVNLLERPRRIVLLMNAGKPVDDVIEHLKPHLERGDIVIDGGNSFFQDTERRTAALEKDGICFMGSGISGGEEGALRGPSIMPGGDRNAYEAVAPVLTKIAAKVDGEPCAAYMGPRGAGHYVKMVHNGIEYGIMQLICETYDLLKRGSGLPLTEIGSMFGEWNQSQELNSYLFEITATVLSKIDSETHQPLVDLILDTAEQKGTGKWMSQNAFDLGVPTPTINAAVESRMLSSFKEQRTAAARTLSGPSHARNHFVPVADIRDALHASIIVSYAQGMALLQAASREYKYDLHLDAIASLWRGGCIIRSKMLVPIKNAFTHQPGLDNLMMDATFAHLLNRLQEPWRRTVQAAALAGIPTLAMASSLNYYDAYRCERLPANLLQAQRDYFGAHTYRRIDREGVFHTQWETGN